jgi:hypothetical protein
MITLNAEQVAQLKNWALEIPTKFGADFLNFIAQLEKENPSTEATVVEAEQA